MRRSRLKIFLLYFAPQFSVYTKFGIDPAFMKKYQTATDSSAMLMDYLSFMQKYNDFSEKANAYDTNEMSTADAAYYLEVTSRVSQKLLQAAS